MPSANSQKRADEKKAAAARSVNARAAAKAAAARAAAPPPPPPPPPPQLTSSAAQVVLETQPPASATLDAPTPSATQLFSATQQPSATPDAPTPSATQLVSETPSAAQLVSAAPTSATQDVPPPSPPADADVSSDCFSIDNFSLQVGGHSLLENTSVEFQKKRQYALLGPSGSGKSRLLAAIENREIEIPQDMNVCYLADGIQESDFTVFDTVFVCDPQEKSRLEERIANPQPEDDVDELCRRLDEIGPKAHYRACQILAGFGFDSYMLLKKTKDFSESWRMKIALAKALCSSPDILLLDNPSKYLDFVSCAWLEKKLRELKCIQVIISNSQSLLSVCTDIIEIDMQNKKIVEHCNTTFNEYMHEKDELGNTSTQAGHKFRFVNVASGIPGVTHLVDWSAVDCVDKNNTVFKNINLTVDLGSRIALVGQPGKSTLLKFLARNKIGLTGTVTSMPGMVIQSFEQNSVKLIDGEHSGIEYMKKYSKISSELSLIKSAKNFGLSEQLVNQKVKFLSDSQRTRLVFSAMSAMKPHLLLFDEPTSHLGWDDVAYLAEGLNSWDGGFVIAGHDLRLINLVAKEIWLCNEQKITKFVTGDIKVYKKDMIEKADVDRCFVRVPPPNGLFPLFSVGSYQKLSMPFLSYLKYIDHQDNCSTEPTVSLDKFKTRRHLTVSAPCNSFEDGFLLIPGEVMAGKRYRVATEAAKKVASSLLEPLWMLETIGLCFSDFTKENIFVTPSGQVKLRGLELLKFSDDQMKKNLSSAFTILEWMFSSAGEQAPCDIECLLDLIKNHPEKREMFHMHSSLVPLPMIWEFYLKLVGCLRFMVEPSLRDTILENLPSHLLDSFVADAQSNILLKKYFDHGNYIIQKPTLLIGQPSLTPDQQKKYNRDRAEKLTVYLRNRGSHPMDHFGLPFRYLPDMANLAAYVRFRLVICYLQEKLYDAGETKNLMLHNYVR